MIWRYGDACRLGLADWHLIIGQLAKPTFDGVPPLTDPAGAIAEARAAALPDPRQAALKRKIDEIGARATGAMPRRVSAPIRKAIARAARSFADPLSQFYSLSRRLILFAR